MKNNLLKILESNLPIINTWLSLSNSFTAEAFGKMGWDSITIDMQHGQSDYQSSIPILQSLSSSNSVPMVRVPWSEPGIIMKMLDLGVMGIIAPMINNKEDCNKFVSYCYYPPIGQRSFGPMRAQLIHGSDYFKNEYFAKRPYSEILIPHRLKLLEMYKMRNWKTSLSEYLEIYLNEINK